MKRLLSPPTYWEALTTGIRIAEFRHLADVIDRAEDLKVGIHSWRAIDDSTVLQMSGRDGNIVADALRHAADVQDRLGPPLTEHAQRRMRAEIRRHGGGRHLTAGHPLAHIARQAAMFSPWPSLDIVRVTVQSLISRTSVALPHRSPRFWLVRQRAFRMLDIALAIVDAEQRKAAVRILGPMMPDAGHLALGILWDLEHLAPDGSWYCSEPFYSPRAVHASELVPTTAKSSPIPE